MQTLPPSPVPPHFAMAHMFGEADPAPTLAQIALAVSSVRRLHPGASVTLMSDRTDLAGLPAGVELKMADGVGGEWMTARLLAYRDLVAGAAAGERLVFMDTDMLLRRPLDRLLADPADIAVTVRNWAEQPINAGLIVANLTRRDRVLAVFDALLATCRALPETERRWFGDQIALERVLDAPRLRLHRSRRGVSLGADILYLPVKVWNNTPRDWQLRLGLSSPFARVLHFKGERKRHMGRYHAAIVGAVPPPA